MRSEDVRELLQAISMQQPRQANKENIFDTPVRLYLMIKTMYQNYKKHHQLQIMQSRIFEITPNKPTTQNLRLTQVSPASLFEYHTLSQSDILLLIHMKDSLKSQAKQQLYQQILKGIQKQKVVAEYLRCYRTLLNQQFMNKNVNLYMTIEAEMISKLLTLERLSGKEVRTISHNLVGLPKITQQILVLISQLYQIVQKVTDFKPLFLIFQTNFPTNPDPVDVQALLRICLPQTLALFKDLLETRPHLRAVILQAAEKEAKHKLRTMQLIKTSKTIYILNFIVETVKLGIPIWHDIIQWQHKAAQEPKNILKNSLQEILVGMLKDFECFGTVVGIIERITDIEQHSEIGLIFVRELLKLDSKEYLIHRVIRRFLAIKILKYNSSQQYFRLIFDRNLKFIEVILEMFNFKSNAISFYQHILSSQEHIHLFENYLALLVKKLPLKFKDFFVKILEADSEKNELFGSPTSSMLRLLCQQVTPEMAANIVKDISGMSPSKTLLIIFTRLLGMFKDKQLGTLKSNLARSLNIMLIRTPKGEINRTFQIHFPIFLKENLFEKMDEVFVNVPEETKQQLKKTFQSFRSRGLPI